MEKEIYNHVNLHEFSLIYIKFNNNLSSIIPICVFNSRVVFLVSDWRRLVENMIFVFDLYTIHILQFSWKHLKYEKDSHEIWV